MPFLCKTKTTPIKDHNHIHQQGHTKTKTASLIEQKPRPVRLQKMMIAFSRQSQAGSCPNNAFPRIKTTNSNSLQLEELHFNWANSATKLHAYAPLVIKSAMCHNKGIRLIKFFDHLRWQPFLGYRERRSCALVQRIRRGSQGYSSHWQGNGQKAWFRLRWISEGRSRANCDWRPPKRRMDGPDDPCEQSRAKALNQQHLSRGRKGERVIRLDPFWQTDFEEKASGRFRMEIFLFHNLLCVASNYGLRYFAYIIRTMQAIKSLSPFFKASANSH